MDTGFNREPQGTLNSMTTGASSLYYLTDALGSVIALVDDTGTKVNSYTYTPRGADRTATEKTLQPYRFAAGYKDPTGLYHLGARYYDPNLGRFPQPDPSGQEKNPCLYADGAPVNRNDPRGLSFLSKVGDFLDSANDIWGAATGCIGGIGAASESGVTTAASTFGPWGTGAAIVGGCAVGGVAGYYNTDLLTYGQNPAPSAPGLN